MEDTIFDKIEEIDLEKKMKESYIDYGSIWKSVLMCRKEPGADL